MVRKKISLANINNNKKDIKLVDIDKQILTTLNQTFQNKMLSQN